MFNLIIKEIKEFLRDKTNLFFFIMFPVVLIFLLGNLLGSTDKAEEAIGVMKIQYQLVTQDQYQVMAVQGFIKAAGENNKQLIFEETQDLEAAKKLAGKDEIAAAVVFTGEPMEIQIYEGTNSTRNRAVSAIFNSFVQSDKAIATVLSVNPQVLKELGTDQEKYVEQKDLGIERTMIDYYAVSMIVMISMMSVAVGAGAFINERKRKTINRLIIAPQNRVAIFLQKVLGLVPQVLLQIFIIMVISVFVFKANYATTIEDNLYIFLMFFVLTICMVSIGAAIGIVLRVHPMLVIMPVMWIMMFLGGTYSKEMYIKGVTDAMPVYNVQKAAYDLAIFGHHEKANYVIIICMLVMLTALVLGAYLFSRKEEER